MPKYYPIVTSVAWHWHLNLEKAVEQGLMKKELDDFTLSRFRYIPILSQPGKSRLLEKETTDAENNEK